MKNRFFLIALAVSTLGLFGPANVRAQDNPQSAVGRISAVHGNVSTMRGDAGEWVAGTVNTPVVPGDKVATAANSRAEIQLDFANILRLDQSTEARIADLTAKRIQIQLASGLADYTIFRGTQADAEIDTPNMGVHPLKDGVYRVQVNSPSETQVVVLRGETEILTQQGSEKVEAGQTIYVHGTDNPEYRVDQAPARDDFDKWAMDRDKQIASAQAWKHTSPEYTGTGDLDAYGQWDYVPGYDWCWTPEVDMGWVPYRLGRWGWEPYWGWTWISYEPWGWAPYHYGRWFMYGDRWHWWPGVGYFGPHPIWAPGYVSFFGFGGGFGVGFGFGFGSLGWLPLGPRDPFRPWWGAGRGFNVVNVNNYFGHGTRFTTVGGRPFGSNLESMMSNARIRGALTTTSSQDFVNGRSGRNFQPASESMLRNANMIHGTLPVVPTRASLGSSASFRGGFNPGAASGEHFYGRSAATVGRTGNFASEASQIRDMVQRGPTANAGSEARFGANAQRGEGSTTAAAGGQRFGGPAGQPAGNSSWQRFASGNSSAKWPAGANMPGSREEQRTGPQGSQSSWQGFSRQPAPGSERTGSAPTSEHQGSWSRFNDQPRSYSGGGSAGSYNWRSGGSSYGGSRPPLDLNRPIMRERSSGGGFYGGGRSYSPPSGGGHSSSAPSGGGHAAPSGGGHGGGGGHSGGGSHGKR